MSRARVAALVVTGALLGLLALAGASSAGSAEPHTVPPPTVVPVPTTVAPTVPVTAVPTTVAATVPAPTTPVPPRVGTEDVAVSMEKDEVDTWSIRRIATTVGIVVVVLAVLGYAYGKVRGAARRSSSSALVASSE